jgi:uncharacterized protein
MIVKKHYHGQRLILAICDEDLIGKRIENETLVLDLGSQFYMGEKADMSEIRELCKSAYIVNAVGKNSTEAIVELDLASPDDIKVIEGIPHIQVLQE